MDFINKTRFIFEVVAVHHERSASWELPRNSFLTCLELLFIINSSSLFNVCDSDITQKYETSGIHAYKHGSNGCFPRGLGRNWPSGIGMHLGRNRLRVRFLAVSDIYYIPCSPSLRLLRCLWGSLGTYGLGYIKIVLKKKQPLMTLTSFHYYYFIYYFINIPPLYDLKRWVCSSYTCV